MMKNFTLLTACILLKHAAFAQKQTTSVQQLWGAYFNQMRFSHHWSSYIEAQFHTKERFVSNWSQSIISVGLNYYFTNNTKLTAGYSFVDNFPSDNHKYISQPEHRIWQQIQWVNPLPRVRLTQWVRLEQRFKRKIKNNYELENDFSYTNRIRYNFYVAAALNKTAFAPKTLALACNDEIYINFGKEIVYNYFDQNRFFVGLNYYPNKHDYLQFGYMNVFEQQTAGNKYRDLHVARIYYFHNLDLRQKKHTSVAD